jgi:vacuolar-type H+-ATPase subunit I/STV1
MSVRQECERRLDDAKLKIRNVNSELATLTRKRDEAIAAGNARLLIAKEIVVASRLVNDALTS